MVTKNSPSKDFSTRYASAKQHRDAIQSTLKEVLMFCCPGREKDFDTATTHGHEDTETYDSLPEELASDFASDLVTYYVPAETRWCSYRVVTEVPEDAAEAVQELVEAREEKLFDLINGSNFNDVAPQIMFEAVHGTPAMWVEAGHIAQSIFVETVPVNELLVTPGHRGYLDRFREKHVPSDTLKALFSNMGKAVDLTHPKISVKMNKPGQTSKVCWGFWLDWDDPGNPIWRSEIVVDDIRVTEERRILGPMAGHCPLLVGRFKPMPGRPYGRGPGVSALRDMRTADKIEEVTLSGLDQAILNTIIYPDDGLLDLSDGLIAGTAIPARPGFDRNKIWQADKNVNVDQGWFAAERFEERLRAAFYQDGPRQRGDTPPTASQWLDERRRTQQRLGKPSAPLWTEMLYPFIQRVEKLGVDLGEMQDAISHAGKAIHVAPISPLQVAQNQDKVMVSRSNLELGFGIFADALPVDRRQTFQNIVKASGDELTVVAEPEMPPDASAPPPPA